MYIYKYMLNVVIIIVCPLFCIHHYLFVTVEKNINELEINLVNSKPLKNYTLKILNTI